MEPTNRAEYREARFVKEFVVDFNLTQAAIRAGYSPKSASAQGSRLLDKPAVQRGIAEEVKKLTEKAALTAEKVLAELALIAFEDMATFLTWDTEGVHIRALEGLPPGMSRCVESISQVATREGMTIRLKLHNKVDALDKLARYFKLFKDEITMPGLEKSLDGLLVWLAELSDLQLRNLTKELAQTNGHQPI